MLPLLLLSIFTCFAVSRGGPSPCPGCSPDCDSTSEGAAAVLMTGGGASVALSAEATGRAALLPLGMPTFGAVVVAALVPVPVAAAGSEGVTRG